MNEVQELLDSLVKVSTRDQKFYSAIDLRSHMGALAGFGLSTEMETVSTGITKSMSSGQMEIPEEDKDVSKGATGFLNDYLGTIEGEDAGDEEFLFFD